MKFILNDQTIEISKKTGCITLDFLRQDKMLVGTKESCREGDCGACTILLGEFENNDIHYRTVASCLLPLGELEGKHVVTIEGLNQSDSNPIQRVIIDEGATQCGFCTPGIVLSFTSFFINSKKLDYESALEFLDGNICRCTGYMSIKRVAAILSNKYSNDVGILSNRIEYLVSIKILPEYFLGIVKKMKDIDYPKENRLKDLNLSATLVAGGTDLFVQKSDELKDQELIFLSNKKTLNKIRIENDLCYINSSTTFQDIKESAIIKKYLTAIPEYFNLISSTLIRNRATVGGNIVNASPIGDFIIILLAMNASIILSIGNQIRKIPLKEFFTGYKKLDLRPLEIIEDIYFRVPPKNSFFNFEKVSRRVHLDIASVNSSIYLEVKDKFITDIVISAGGVAAIPSILTNISENLKGKELSSQQVRTALGKIDKDISPISDVRGSAQYKRLLLRQLIIAHFIKIFPDIFRIEDLL